MQCSTFIFGTDFDKTLQDDDVNTCRDVDAASHPAQLYDVVGRLHFEKPDDSREHVTIKTKANGVTNCSDVSPIYTTDVRTPCPIERRCKLVADAENTNGSCEWNCLCQGSYVCYFDVGHGKVPYQFCEARISK